MEVWAGRHGILLTLLRLSYWLSLSFAFLLLARACVDALTQCPQYREKVLPLDNLLVAITDPFLAPIRRILYREGPPPWLDFSPFVGILICWIYAMCASWVMGRLP